MLASFCQAAAPHAQWDALAGRALPVGNDAAQDPGKARVAAASEGIPSARRGMCACDRQRGTRGRPDAADTASPVQCRIPRGRVGSFAGCGVASECDRRHRGRTSLPSPPVPGEKERRGLLTTIWSRCEVWRAWFEKVAFRRPSAQRAVYLPTVLARRRRASLVRPACVSVDARERSPEQRFGGARGEPKGSAQPSPARRRGPDRLRCREVT